MADRETAAVSIQSPGSVGYQLEHLESELERLGRVRLDLEERLSRVLGPEEEKDIADREPEPGAGSEHAALIATYRDTLVRERRRLEVLLERLDL